MRIALTITCLLFLIPAYGQEEAEQLVEYQNALWWDGRSEVSGSRYVRGDRFVDGDGADVDAVVDLNGAIVTAPFAEGHNHNVVHPIFDHANREYLENGVFYVKIPGIHPPGVAAIRVLLDRADTIDATFSLGNITAPGGHPVPIYVGFLSELLYDGASYEDYIGLALHEVESEAEIQRSLNVMSARGTDFIKTVLVHSEEFESGRREGLNPDLLPFLVREAHALGLSVSLHIDSPEDFRRGVTAGVDEIAHLPGYIGERGKEATDYLLSADDAARAAEAGVAVVTTTHYIDVIARRFGAPADRVARFKAIQRENLGRLIESGIEIRIGSDVYDRDGDGEGANPTRNEVENLVDLGVFNAEAALSRWIDTGRQIFPERRIACFDVGCEASFLVFNADPRGDLADLNQLTLAVKQGIDVTQPRRPVGGSE